MSNKPLLTVAIVIHNQRDIIESTLTSLYGLSSIPFELFLIDDGSTDGSSDAIESLLDFHQHEQTFYFPHQKAVGRGNSLNEAILQGNGPFFWAPETIQDIDENKLKKHLKELSDSTSSVLIQQQNLPSSHRQWVDFIKQNDWPQDGAFIWNLPEISSANHFFNPYLQQYHGLELAARLGEVSGLKADQKWYQPSTFAQKPETDSQYRQELLLTILRQTGYSSKSRSAILEKLNNLNKEEHLEQSKKFDNRLLSKALQMKKDGRFNSALELIDEVLANQSGHPEAQKLKVEILEKKRRFVEASEIKHEINKSEKREQQTEQKMEEPSESTSEDTQVSLIIPSTAHGKPALEHCLLSISKHCDTSGVELIVIDNASLDDTHDYLNQLKEKEFLNCRVITNKQNAGFAVSINQGLEIANGEYACILHNDVEFTDDALSQLKNLMDDHPEFTLIGPSTNKTLNPDQAQRNVKDDDPQLMRAEYLDSFCMMMRMNNDLKMDPEYELAFYEDIDLCFQARANDHTVGIAPHISVDHHFGSTTFSLDLDTESEQYWENVTYFNEKWDIEIFAEEELKSLGTFDQLLALDELVNPLFPEEKIKNKFQELYTDELKTEILKAEHKPETLCKLVHLFMVMEEREIMRELENRLEDIELPTSLLYQLVRFYFNRNIYSRCMHYLNQLKPQNDSLRADLYRLAISVENKDFGEAIPMLKNLMDKAPANPMLYKLAGDIHKFNGNEEEASSFYDLAEQIDPFSFTNEQKDTFGFEV